MHQNTDLYLPIEVKGRELAASVLLATRALKRDFSPYIGSREAVYHHIRKRKNRHAILLYKSNLPPQLKRSLRKYVHYLCVLDQEVGPVIDDYRVTTAERLADGTDSIDRWFTVGPRAQNAAIEYFGSKAIETGWPRLDLCHLARSGKYLPSTDIPPGVRPFVLFASNLVIDEQLRHQIATWDEYSKDLNLVIRPHPGERLALWRNLVADRTHVFMMSDGDPHAWVEASEAVAHTGSTVGIESLIIGRPSYLISCIGSPIPRTYLSLSSDSLKVGLTLKEVSELVSQKLKGPASLRSEPFDLACLDSIVRLDHGLASDRIIEELGLMRTNAERVALVHRIQSIAASFKNSPRIGRFLKVVRSYSGQKASPVNVQSPSEEFSPKMPNGISLQEVRRILADLRVAGEFGIDEIGLNIFRLYLQER